MEFQKSAIGTFLFCPWLRQFGCVDKKLFRGRSSLAVAKLQHRAVGRDSDSKSRPAADPLELRNGLPAIRFKYQWCLHRSKLDLYTLLRLNLGQILRLGPSLGMSSRGHCQ